MRVAPVPVLSEHAENEIVGVAPAEAPTTISTLTALCKLALMGMVTAAEAFSVWGYSPTMGLISCGI
jgi:hypothetical protein